MMSAPGRGSALLRNSHRVCTQCARPAPRPRITTPARAPSSSRAIFPLTARRYYAAEAATATTTTTTTTTTPPPPSPPAATTTTTTTTTDAPHYRIKSSLILTRAPLITPEQTPFESAFFLYQKRLNERLTAPFRRGFFFKPDTAADLDFGVKLHERRGVPAQDIGRYNPRSRMAWNDEVLVGSTTSSPADVVERLLADAEVRVSEDGEPIADEERVPVEKPMPRRTEADKKGDVRRLDRALERTLYLVVRKGGEGDQGGTARRVLSESAGDNMNTWVVGRVPVAHHVVKPVLGEDGASVVQRGEKVFFLKGRIMAGQADLAGNKHGLTDFKWLTRDELKEVFSEDYYRSVRGMMELR
ncbi:39S mitochondrial ribosomal protein L46-domain-containing protein [Chaetomidium leptoderma]|uniref:Large ribosomal subunit protein mL46 n=1 Tax=Chaetomidium leptoderma TaxID=669021 RepID=A0AAN6VRZ1_9PEZI|nr:39S mitochondrial ribosomal protein L46-domain-containing protein [Chaetomidium leptoderma]